MSVKISGHVWELDLEPMDKLVLLALADHADHEGNNVRPGNELLCAKTGLSQQTISAKIKKFTDAGFLAPSAGKFGRGKKREFSIEPEAGQRHEYFIEKDRKKAQARRTFQEAETYKQSVPLEPERYKLTDQKVQADSGKVQSDASAYKEVIVIEPSKEPSCLAKDDGLYEKFCEAFLQSNSCPYLSKRADFIQLAELKKKSLSLGWEITQERFAHALRNYFSSELGNYTLADLSTRFSTFYRAALDRFGKPKTIVNSTEIVKSNGSGMIVDPAKLSPKTRGNAQALEDFINERRANNHA